MIANRETLKGTKKRHYRRSGTGLQAKTRPNIVIGFEASRNGVRTTEQWKVPSKGKR